MQEKRVKSRVEHQLTTKALTPLPRAVRLPDKIAAERFMELFLARIGSLTVGKGALR